MNRPPDFHRLGLGPRHVEHDPQVALGRLQRFAGVHELDFRGLVERFDTAHFGGGAYPFLLHPPRAIEQDGKPLACGLGEPDRLARAEHVAEGHVQVVDLEPNRVLILGLEHSLGAAGDDRPRPALVGHVDGISDVHVVLKRASGALPASSVPYGMSWLSAYRSGFARRLAVRMSASA